MFSISLLKRNIKFNKSVFSSIYFRSFQSGNDYRTPYFLRDLIMKNKLLPQIEASYPKKDIFSLKLYAPYGMIDSDSLNNTDRQKNTLEYPGYEEYLVPPGSLVKETITFLQELPLVQVSKDSSPYSYFITTNPDTNQQYILTPYLLKDWEREWKKKEVEENDYGFIRFVTGNNIIRNKKNIPPLSSFDKEYLVKLVRLMIYFEKTKRKYLKRSLEMKIDSCSFCSLDQLYAYNTGRGFLNQVHHTIPLVEYQTFDKNEKNMDMIIDGRYFNEKEEDSGSFPVIRGLITPFGYFNTYMLPFYNHQNEYELLMKDIFFDLRLKSLNQKSYLDFYSINRFLGSPLLTSPSFTKNNIGYNNAVEDFQTKIWNIYRNEIFLEAMKQEEKLRRKEEKVKEDERKRKEEIEEEMYNQLFK